jgi:hypothetical protein
MENLRSRIEDGDVVAMVTALRACLSAAVLPPLWLTEKLLPFVDRWLNSQARTLDEAFGVRREHKQFEVQQRNARLRPFIVHRVLKLSAEDKEPIRTVFAKVADELRTLAKVAEAKAAEEPSTHPDGDSVSTGAKVEAIYRQPESRDWEKFFKAVARNAKPPKEGLRLLKLQKLLKRRPQKQER